MLWFLFFDYSKGFFAGRTHAVINFTIKHLYPGVSPAGNAACGNNLFDGECERVEWTRRLRSIHWEWLWALLAPHHVLRVRPIKQWLSPSRHPTGTGGMEVRSHTKLLLGFLLCPVSSSLLFAVVSKLATNVRSRKQCPLPFAQRWPKLYLLTGLFSVIPKHGTALQFILDGRVFTVFGDAMRYKPSLRGKRHRLRVALPFFIRWGVLLWTDFLSLCY